MKQGIVGFLGAILVAATVAGCKQRPNPAAVMPAVNVPVVVSTSPPSKTGLIIQAWIAKKNGGLTPSWIKFFNAGAPGAFGEGEAPWKPIDSDFIKLGAPIASVTEGKKSWKADSYLYHPGRPEVLIEKLSAQAQEGGLNRLQISTRSDSIWKTAVTIDSCFEYAHITDQKDGSVLVDIDESGCGSGYSKILYRIEKSGRLKQVAKQSSWQGDIWLKDIDGDGMPDLVLHSRVFFPSDLKDAVGGADAEMRANTLLYVNAVYLNKGDSFKEAARFYDRDEQW